MRLDATIIQRTKDAQARVFRLAERDYGLTRKAISLDARVDYDTLGTYAKGEAMMPVSVLFALVGVIPDALLSLLLPDGRSIVQVPENIDHDEISTAMRDYIDAKERSHHPESEAGREIGPGEDKTLRRKFAVVAGGRA